jgi:hypothetical protein
MGYSLIFSLGVRKFGKNFKVIAEILGTKTESHVRSFFVNYRRRYNLDLALKEYESEHGPTPTDDEDTKMDSSNSGTPSGENSPAAPGSPSRAKSPSSSSNGSKANGVEAK